MAEKATPLESLPAKDRLAFRASTKFYDDRKFGKAAKGIDQLLKKHPACLELLSMKCLVLRNIPERKDEALATVKQALKIDIRSSVAWHAMGSYYKMEGAYKDALASYRQAVKCSPNMPQLLNDLSYMQLYLQQYDAFLITRQQLLKFRDDEKRNWFAVPMGLHLAGKPLEAAELLLEWWSIPAVETTPQLNTEVSPLLLLRIAIPQLRLYLAVLLEEGKEYERALNHLKAALAYDPTFTDYWAALTIIGRVQLRLGHFEDAKETYRSLIIFLPENTDYLFGFFIAHTEFHSVLPSPYSESGSQWLKVYPDILTNEGVRNSDWLSQPLQAALKVDETTLTSLVDAAGRSSYSGVRKTEWNRGNFWELIYRREHSISVDMENAILDWTERVLEFSNRSVCDPITAFPLAFLRSEKACRTQLAKLFRVRLEKASPVVFSMIKSFWSTNDETRRAWATDTVVAEAQSIGAESSSPLVPMMGKCVQAMDAIYRERNVTRGLKLVYEAAATVPTFSEISELKANLLSHCGYFVEAADVLEQARLMDLADRYLNDRTARARLEAGQMDAGLKLYAEFQSASEQKSSDPPPDVQSTNHDLLIAMSYLKCGSWDEAAAGFQRVLQRSAEIKIETQNFYVYCLRRGCMRKLVEYIQLAEKYTHHRDYQQAAIRLVDLCMAKAQNMLHFNNMISSCTNAPSCTNAFKLSEMKNPLEKAEEILGVLRGSCGLGTFKSNQRSYMLHSRSEGNFHKPLVLVQALSNMRFLSGGRIDHPKLVPYLLHWSASISTNSSIADEDILQTFVASLPLDLETQCVDALSKLGASSVLKDNMAVVKATDLILSESQTVSPALVETMVSLLNQVATEIPARIASSTENSVNDVLRCGPRLRRLLEIAASRARCAAHSEVFTLLGETIGAAVQLRIGVVPVRLNTISS